MNRYCISPVGSRCWDSCFLRPPLLILLPILHICGRQNELPIGVRTLLSIGILNIPLTLGFILLTDGMYRALYAGHRVGPGGRRRSMACCP